MKSFLNWKVLFGLLIALTTALASLIMFGVTSDRNRIQTIMAKLTESVATATKENQKLNYEIDSMTSKLQDLTATVKILEAQKDSLKKGIRRATSTVTGKKEGSSYLYMNCQNIVLIEIPSAYKKANLTYSAKGAIITKTSIVGQVQIIPTEREVEVTVKSGAKVIKSEVFPVRLVPKPRYVVRDTDGNEVDLINGIDRKSLSLRMNAEAGADVRTSVPRCAVYRVRSLEVILARKGQRVATINATSEYLNLTSWSEQCKPGDIIMIDIKTVTRRTFTDQEEKVDIVAGTITIPIRESSQSTVTPKPNSSGDNATYTVRYKGGQLIDLQKGIKAPNYFLDSTIIVSAGAGFKIKKTQLVLGRGTKRIIDWTMDGDMIYLNRIWLAQPQPGDKIGITILEMVRVREGKETPAAIAGGPIVIPIY